MLYSLHGTLKSAYKVSVRKSYFCHPHFTGRVAEAFGDYDFSKVNSGVPVFFSIFLLPLLPPSLPSSLSPFLHVGHLFSVFLLLISAPLFTIQSVASRPLCTIPKKLCPLLNII